MSKRETSDLNIDETMNLSLEAACTDDAAFLENSKGIYESMKLLKKEIDTHERKKKALELQIEKLRIAFMEYVQSIETIEKSEIYKRALPCKKLNHSRVLKYSHLFLPPSISSDTSIDLSLASIIKKACAEYKEAKLRYDALIALKKSAAGSTAQLELETKFQIYEKRANFIQHKMGFSIQANKLTLSLLKAIFTEVEMMEKISTDHAALCASMQKIKEHQYTSLQNAISPLIAKEVHTLAQVIPEEVERLKRKTANETRPVNEEHIRPLKDTLIQRKLIPETVGFLVPHSMKTPLESFFVNFEVDGRTVRGSFDIHRDMLAINEMIFGWKYAIQRTEIQTFKLSQASVTLSTFDHIITAFCTQDNIDSLCRWYNNSAYENGKAVLIGKLASSVESIFENIFKQDMGECMNLFKKNGYTLLDSQLKENRIRKRVFLKKLKKRMFFISVLYTERYIIDDDSSDTPSIIIHSDVKIFRWMPSLVGISKLYLRRNNEETDVYYLFEKNMSMFIFEPFSRIIIQNIIKTLHMACIDEENKVIYPMKTSILDLVSANMMVGLLSVFLASTLCANIYKLVLR